MLVVPVEKRLDWKKPPIVLIAIVLLNIFIFLFYQSGDEAIYEQAYEMYAEKGLKDIEQSAYRAYLLKNPANKPPSFDEPELAWYMLSDESFAAFLENNQYRYISSDKRQQWYADRALVNELIDGTSVRAFGLNSKKTDVVTLFSHQFLHGDIMHLLSNMVFLLLTGFAVEVALGHKRFLLYYLLSGLGGGLLFAAIESYSGGPGIRLVGASGAISGVMAMYVMLFGMRKIEFFYWVFVFTGYFRAAAIIMLPAYILKELFLLFSNDGSNVAYTAHIGGFLAGAALVIATKSLIKQAIDDDYLDGENKVSDPYQLHLDSLYKQLRRCEFKKAWASLQSLKQQYPSKIELRDIEYNILLALKPDKADAFALQYIGRRGNGRVISQAQCQYWSRASQQQRLALSTAQKCGIADAQIELDQTQVAEDIYELLKSSDLGEFETKEQHLESISLLGRKLAMYFRGQNYASKAQRYEEEARKAMQASLPSNAEGVR